MFNFNRKSVYCEACKHAFLRNYAQKVEITKFDYQMEVVKKYFEYYCPQHKVKFDRVYENYEKDDLNFTRYYLKEVEVDVEGKIL